MSNLQKNKHYFQKSGQTIKDVQQELKQGLVLLNQIKKPVVTFFGSHIVGPRNRYYQDCRQLTGDLGRAGDAIMTGGGPGVMQAANQGAHEAGAPSIGIKAKLIRGENVTAPVYTHKLSFRFLFVRRFILSIKSQAMVFYPGGYGTLNELFEYLVLMQTGMADHVPLICVDRKFWQGLFDWVDKYPLRQKFLTNWFQGIRLLHFIDDRKGIISVIKKSAK